MCQDSRFTNAKLYAFVQWIPHTFFILLFLLPKKKIGLIISSNTLSGIFIEISIKNLFSKHHLGTIQFIKQSQSIYTYDTTFEFHVILFKKRLKYYKCFKLKTTKSQVLLNLFSFFFLLLCRI